MIVIFIMWRITLISDLHTSFHPIIPFPPLINTPIWTANDLWSLGDFTFLNLQIISWIVAGDIHFIRTFHLFQPVVPLNGNEVFTLRIWLDSLVRSVTTSLTNILCFDTFYWLLKRTPATLPHDLIRSVIGNKSTTNLHSLNIRLMNWTSLFFKFMLRLEINEFFLTTFLS